jgi:hypothetical protein
MQVLNWTPDRSPSSPPPPPASPTPPPQLILVLSVLNEPSRMKVDLPQPCWPLSGCAMLLPSSLPFLILLKSHRLSSESRSSSSESTLWRDGRGDAGDRDSDGDRDRDGGGCSDGAGDCGGGCGGGCSCDGDSGGGCSCGGGRSGGGGGCRHGGGGGGLRGGGGGGGGGGPLLPAPFPPRLYLHFKHSGRGPWYFESKIVLQWVHARCVCPNALLPLPPLLSAPPPSPAQP